MTIKPRVVRALRDARSRLRDAAAAAHSTAAATRDQSAEQLQREHATLDTALDEATTMLANARTVHDLDRVADATGAYRIAVADATNRHAQDLAASELTSSKLRERSRQLRTAERLVDLVDERRTKREARAEQSGADDMAARRK